MAPPAERNGGAHHRTAYTVNGTPVEINDMILAGFAKEFAQPVVNGLIGLACIAVGFLFGRRNQ